MQISERQGSKERQILVGMITNATVCGRIASRWERGLFASTWANIVGQWCVDYYQLYQEAPCRQIIGLFASWAEKNQDKETTRIVENFLESLSDEYEQSDGIQPDYLTDLAGEHFNQVQASKTIQLAQGDLDHGDLDSAISRLSTYRKVEVGVGAAIDVFQDTDHILSVLNQEDHNTIIRYPGAIGELFGTILELDGFVAVRASDKVGKSWLLLDMAMRSTFARQKTAYFQVGDMSERQILSRFYVRMALHPIRSPDWPPKWPCSIKWPISIEPATMINGKRQAAKIEYAYRKFKKPLDYKKVVEAGREIMENRTKSMQSHLRLSCHPNMSVTVSQIRDKVKSWAIDGFFPKAILIDYADVLAPPVASRTMDRRDQVNENWNQMRALSQELHCLVVTASQADTEAYRKEIQDRANFSEDKRQNAHVTAMIAMNQTAAEKDAGQFRLQIPFRREADFSPRRCVHVASCLALAHPTVRSCWESRKKD